MGYTHYWRHNRTIPQNIWNKIIKDIKKLLPRFKMLSIELTGWDGSGKPIFDKGQVSFNGRPEHETFSIDRDFDMYSRNHLTNLDNDGRSFSFCKTAMKPYDLAVTACLIVFTYHQPDILVSSDGEDRDWVKAKTLCQQVLGYGDNFRLPGDEDDRTRPNFRTNEPVIPAPIFRFRRGRVIHPRPTTVLTSEVKKLKLSDNYLREAIQAHLDGIWGGVSEEERKRNEENKNDKGRLVSLFTYSHEPLREVGGYLQIETDPYWGTTVVMKLGES